VGWETRESQRHVPCSDRPGGARLRRCAGCRSARTCTTRHAWGGVLGGGQGGARWGTEGHARRCGVGLKVQQRREEDRKQHDTGQWRRRGAAGPGLIARSVDRRSLERGGTTHAGQGGVRRGGASCGGPRSGQRRGEARGGGAAGPGLIARRVTVCFWSAAGQHTAE
jgi:hypothetical protein